jgi:putative FmdB family regulatory protein
MGAPGQCLRRAVPIYEYLCEQCGKVSSAIVLRPEDEKETRCAGCGARELTRIPSRFAVHKTEEQRIREFDTGSPRGEAFYRDSRNVGLWAKKRAREVGADLGSQFDEVVERARSGKILEDYDK